MEQKINIAELLKDCPKGMELDCTMYDNLYFDKVNEDCIYPVGCYTIYDGCRTSENFTEFGEFNNYGSAKCVIFPKGKTTWEGFVPPCKFKDGDVLVHTQNGRFIMSIYKSNENEKLINTHVIFWDREEGLSVGMQICCYTDNVRFATKEEKAKLFQAIKDNGYKWNPETKTLEKLVEPKFKVGDKVKDKNNRVWCIVQVSEKHFDVSSVPNAEGYFVPIEDQDEYELVPNKFDISTLKPFDKVLARDSNEQVWTCDWFSFHDIKQVYPFACVGHYVSQCIPFVGNEHLLGTTHDCDEFYKIW